MSLFFRQFWALFWKNWIVLSKHPFLNLLRCFILPVAYGIFLAVAQLFLSKPNNYGIGSPAPVHSLASQFDGSLSLIWADGTNKTGIFTAQDIMDRVTQDFKPYQLNAVKQVGSPSQIPKTCPQNFNLFSECFAAVQFDSIPQQEKSSESVKYTIRADGGLFHVDVVRHTGDFEKRILPLQWAVDKAIMELTTNTNSSTPLEWPFTIATNAEQYRDIRLSYIRGLRTLLVIALFICFIGISYQLPGSFGGERANGLTGLMKASGLLDSARIISWITSISLAYLPAWIIVALIWHYRIFTATNAGLILVVHLLLGFSLASWALFVAAPFGKSPQLAAISATFLSIVFAILALVFSHASTGAAFIFALIFPPGFYIFAIRAICGFENHLLATNILKNDPDDGLMLLPILIAAIIDIFLWPWIGVLVERRLYDPREPSTGRRSWFSFGRRKSSNEAAAKDMPSDTAVSIKNLVKKFTNRTWYGRNRGTITAVADLSFNIPKNGIFVLLGSNGAGKSTSLSIIGGLAGRSSGSIAFEGGVKHPARGDLGIVPQKNVLFPELSCHQTVHVWEAIKRPNGAPRDDIVQLLKDCDLAKKIYANADALSGGQKRKLQLACGLVGGSKLVLVDECTSGVDPLSRRALWRTLTAVRDTRTIVFTTHFLDEADLLADNIAILAAPGKLVALGTPVELKSRFGEGYTLHVNFQEAHGLEKEGAINPLPLLERIRTLAPRTAVVSSSPSQYSYQLGIRDTNEVEKVLELMESETGLSSYDVSNSSIESVFLTLMEQNQAELSKSESEKRMSSEDDSVVLPVVTVQAEKAVELTNGRSQSKLKQALVIFYKRVLITRRSWISLFLAILVAVAGSCIPLFFMSNRPQSCITHFTNVSSIPLFLPLSSLSETSGGSDNILASPSDVLQTVLQQDVGNLYVQNIANNQTFISTIQQDYQSLALGGVSVDLQSGSSLLAYESTPPGINGPAMLNLVSNLLYNHALNSTSNAGDRGPSLIEASFQEFPPVDAGTLVALKWVAFFGAAMAVYPAFFSLYVSRERRSAVQAMQFSNGLSDPISLWLGHLLFDSIFSIIVATIVIIVWAAASNQFHGLGIFWVVLVLYGIAGALFSYCVSLVVSSPLAAFSLAAGYQVIMFLLYLAGYLLTLTYAKTSSASHIITTIHFTLSLISPVASVLRASFVSVNLFSLLCDGTNVVDTSSMGDIMRYGGPIVYLFGWIIALFIVLVWVDSGSILPKSLIERARKGGNSTSSAENSDAVSGKPDVVAEAAAVARSNDLLRVLGISKTYGKKKVVDNVSFGVSRDTVFALLGPNGAGKTTTFNMIRGDVVPDRGDVLLNETSIVYHPRTARLALGVCPQFTAIDSQLTVREHLIVYGRLKGLRSGSELEENVDAILRATALITYADRLASKLSGGNQRKLSLAVALMGNPHVILIDEFSTGIDAKMKREMWATLRTVAAGKAVVITTHSMEEASALATKVGIMAKQVLAVGTTKDLEDRYATYQVHFSARTREDILHVQELMSQISGAKMADDVATRFEVPIQSQGDGAGGLSLRRLFHVLSTQESSFSVEKANLESVFLKVIRRNNVSEEDIAESRGKWRMC